MTLSARWLWIFQIAMGLALIAIGLASRATTSGQLVPSNLRKAAPNFVLIDEKGSQLKLSDYRGRVVLLDFWATWCHGCQTEIPWYMEFESKYKGQGLTVVGVSMDADGWKSVRPFMADKKMNYDVVIGDNSLGRKFGLSSMPLTLLIDRSGKIADSHAGVVDKTVWEHEIQELLREKTASTARRVANATVVRGLFR